jgi:hypothetical protein
MGPTSAPAAAAAEHIKINPEAQLPEFTTVSTL